MARADDFGTCPQLVMDQGMDRMIAHPHAEGGRDPLLDLPIGGEAIRLLQALAELGHLLGRQGGAFAGGDVDREQGGEPAITVVRQPAANRIAIQAKEGGDGRTIRCLPAGEQIEGVQTLAFAMVALLLKSLLEVVGRFVNDREGLVHGYALDMPLELVSHA